MILKYEDQEVHFDVDYIKQKNKIGMSLSGGTDSALVFYLLCKYVDDIVITPWCGIDKYRPAHILYAREIYQIMCEKFPDKDIKPMHEFDIDTKNKKWIDYSKTKVNQYNIAGSGFVKSIICGYESNKLIKSGEINMQINGLTSNPPKDIAKKLGFYDKCEERRFSIDNQTKLKSTYKPFRNVNKKWVYGMYKTHDLLKWLYPYTQSCTGFAKQTDWFTKPCGQCFWCYEKKWAFGSFDLCFDL